MRLTNEQLNEIKKKYNVSKLYSWSKVNCFMTSPYEYYLKYILHKKEDVDNNAYAPLGGICHNIIEQFYNKSIKYNHMIGLFKDGYVTAIDIADLKFDRNDEDKNNSIKEKYKYDLEHFFRYHSVIESYVAIEKFIATQIGNFVFQGYVDAVYKDKDGFYNIIDWKTSSKYSGKSAEEKCGQLVIYAIGLSQMGIPMDKIKICWNFLKYCDVLCEQANGTKKNRIIERCKIGESLQSNVKMWLKKHGYNPDEYLKDMIDLNSIESLPEEVQAHYCISDCYVYVELTEKLIDKWNKILIENVKDIERREKAYYDMKNRGINEEDCSKQFWDTDENVKKQSFYFATLCGYSANLHKPYQKYLETLEEVKNGQNLYDGVGSDTENQDNDNVVKSNSVNDTSKVSNSDDELDLSFLNDL